MSNPLDLVRATSVRENRLRNRITVRVWRLRGLRSEDFSLNDLIPILVLYAVVMLIVAFIEPIPTWAALVVTTGVLVGCYATGLLALPVTLEAKLAIEGAPQEFGHVVDDAQMMLRLTENRPSPEVLSAVSEALADVVDANRYIPRHAVEDIAPAEIRPMLVERLEAMAEED